MVKIKTLNEQLKPSLMSMAIVPSRFSSTVKIGADGSINNNEETIIQLGRQGENNITSIIFDKSALNITAEEIKRDYIEELIFIQNGKDPIIQIFENGIYKVQEVITKTPGVYGIVYLLKEKNITSGDNKEIFTSAIFSGVVKSSIYEYKPVGELIEAPSAKDTKLEKPIINLQWNEDELDPSIQAAAKLGYRQDELVTKIQLAPLQCGITDPDEYDIYYYHPNYGSYAYKMNAGRFSWVPKEITDYAGEWQVAIAAKNNARNEVFFSDIIKLTVVENKLNEDTPLLVGIDELLKVDPAGPKPLLSEAEIAASKEFILSYTGQEVQELLDKINNFDPSNIIEINPTNPENNGNIIGFDITQEEFDKIANEKNITYKINLSLGSGYPPYFIISTKTKQPSIFEPQKYMYILRAAPIVAFGTLIPTFIALTNSDLPTPKLQMMLGSEPYGLNVYNEKLGLGDGDIGTTGPTVNIRTINGHKVVYGDNDPNESQIPNNLEFYTNEEVNKKLFDKQDKLIAGTGISIAEDGKTISAIDTGYKLPQATSNTLGGIKAALRTAEDTQEIKIDAQTGKLYTKAGGGGGVNIEVNNGEPTTDKAKSLKINDVNYSIPQVEINNLQPTTEVAETISLDGKNYSLPQVEMTFSDTEVEGATPVKNIKIKNTKTNEEDNWSILGGLNQQEVQALIDTSIGNVLKEGF